MSSLKLDGTHVPHWNSGSSDGPEARSCIAQVAKKSVGLLLFLEEFLNQESDMNKPYDHRGPDGATKNTESA
jgi:hypothetical protein